MKLSNLLLALSLSLGLLGSIVVGQEAATVAEDAVTSTTTEEATIDLDEAAPEEAGEEKVKENVEETQAETAAPPVQSGPLVDLLGPSLFSLDMVDETHAQFVQHTTSDALRGKKVIGLYFSADWCGPCRQFTPELVTFYDKMNNRRGKKDQFEIVWVSRCRDVDAYGQYFTHMNWLALPPDEAMGQRGQMLSDKYKVKGIPSLVLLDDLGEVITTDARNKIPADKAGIGFPWRNPLASVYVTLFPRSLRLMVKSQISSAKTKVVQKVKSIVGLGAKPARATA